MTDLSERAFVGALLHLPAARVVPLIARVRSDDLTDPRLRVVYALAGQLAVSGIDPDPPTVHGHARSTGAVMSADLPALTGLLVDLLTECPMPGSAQAYARSVVEAAARRRIAIAAERLTVAAEASDITTLAQVVDVEVEAVEDALGRLAEAPLAVVA